VGAPSTGKSTLAQQAAGAFMTEWVPEYGREYWEKHQVDRRLSAAQLVEIAEGHRDRENARRMLAGLEWTERKLGRWNSDTPFSNCPRIHTADRLRWFHEFDPGAHRRRNQCSAQCQLNGTLLESMVESIIGSDGRGRY
jgi:hypothetical protein